ncbi:unnamed protein product [Thlaspi arvense]|uniref:CRAL-TRIO domain-containing protein n=1 Tax=Thlaspi arvense TaxID=13288 RepID=A0AAU9S1K1_THLAR|nr:unnamed protein product [Thlaspi arvense]
MGKKDEKVEAVLHVLRKQSPLTLKQEKFCNRECVERFLKGKGENVKKAAKQLISCLSWRQNIAIERLGAEEFSTELADGVAYIAGHDGESRPVIIYAFGGVHDGDCDLEHVQKRGTERCSSLRCKSSSAFANLLLATLKIIADNYPCRLYKAFIIDTPSFFSYIWKGVRPFVELSTVTLLVSSLDYDEQLDFSHVSSSSNPRSASLRFDALSIKSTPTIGSASSRFAFTVPQNSLKPWYLSFTDTSPLNAAVSTASKVSPISARSLSFASPAARGIRDATPAACRKSLFPSTPLPEKTKTVSYRQTPRPSFFQSPAMFFRGEKNIGGGGEKSSCEAFVPYLKFYRRPYDETAYRSKLRGPRGFVSVVSSHRRSRHVSFSQRF